MSPRALVDVDVDGINSFVYYIDFRHESNLPVHGEACAKTEIYRERFWLLPQRVSRAEYFSKPTIFDAEMLQFNKLEISSIQSLIFDMGKKWVMGMLSQLEDGHFYLEDLSGSVEIDLSKAISLLIW